VINFKSDQRSQTSAENGADTWRIQMLYYHLVVKKQWRRNR